MKKKFLFLDDERSFEQVYGSDRVFSNKDEYEVTTVKDFWEFKNAVETDEFDVYSLDYYLDHPIRNGMLCLEVLVPAIDPKEVLVLFHSSDKDLRQEMRDFYDYLIGYFK